MVDCSDDHVVHLIGESLLNVFHNVMELLRITGAVEIKGQILGINFMLEEKELCDLLITVLIYRNMRPGVVHGDTPNIKNFYPPWGG